MMESENLPLEAIERSSVSDFFKGKSVFITGATGFMGKVLVQKLLHHCPGVDKIYLVGTIQVVFAGPIQYKVVGELIRPKGEHGPSKRLEVLFKAPIFDSLSEDSLGKVVAVAGDITMPELGISKEDEETLINEVSVVFHCAATIKFDEDLTKSVKMNLEGTRLIANLARRMTNLKALVHTSTAYSHCYLEHIEERFYPCPNVTPETLKTVSEVAEGCEHLQNVLNNPLVTKSLISRHPNTYTFTKALAEQYLYETAQDLPLAIVRPSIVVAAWKHPIPGWIDNLNGPTGMITGAASGVLRSILVDAKNRADIIPVDVVINMLCVVARNLGVNWNGPTETVPIYNCTSGELNPITWGEIKTLMREGVKKYPLQKMLWFPNLMYQTNPWIQLFFHVLLHKLPAVVVDFLAWITGNRPFLRKIVKRIEKASSALEFFSLRQWRFDSNNIVELKESLSEDDQEIFDLDIGALNWEEFMVSYAYGARHFVLKSDPSTLEASIRKGKILYYLHTCLVFWICFAVFAFAGSLLPIDEIPEMAKIVFNCLISYLAMVWIVDFRLD